MSEQENIAKHDAALDAQLRLFCQLMLGSTDDADRMLQQIYRRTLVYHDEQENRPSECVRLFRIAADLCGVRRYGALLFAVTATWPTQNTSQIDHPKSEI